MLVDQHWYAVVFLLFRSQKYVPNIINKRFTGTGLENNCIRISHKNVVFLHIYCKLYSYMLYYNE